MSLPVTYEGAAVGAVDLGDDGRFRFQYAGSWLEAPRSFPISVTLPLVPEAHAGPAAHAFFANLLPEGNVRTLVSRRLGLSEDNDYALLEAIGGECAGALVVGRAPEVDGYRPLEVAELDRFNRTGQAFARLSEQPGIRLSLAGAQDKLPVRFEDGAFSVPVGAASSTHIIKFASRDFAHLPANEAFVTALAGRLGLPVCTSELHALPSDAVLLVTRYDRVRDEDGIRRLHQEDFCQALGLPPIRKYETEGGPSFADCYRLVLDHSREPLLDARALLTWLAFNAVAGNADGHAKNLSLLRRPDGALRLAPFYDLVGTSCYRLIDRRLAMRVGDNTDPGTIRGSDWRRLAAEIGVRPRFLLDQVADLAERLPALAAESAGGFRTAHGDHPVLQMILPRLRRQSRRTLELLRQ
jgi:serine/threonine-protein kinase HipA